MRRFLFLSLLVFLSIAGAVGKPINAELPPFTKVIVCIPLALSVRPTSSEDKFDYSIYIKAEQHVTETIQYEVTDGVLYLSLSGDLAVDDPAHIVVVLPADKLTAVENYGLDVILVESGFNVKSMTLEAASGYIRADDVALDGLTIGTFTSGTVVVDGTIGKATIKADGFSTVVTKGIQKKAIVSVDGRSNVFITGSPDKDISGSTAMFGNVYVDASASCDMSSRFFGGECKSIGTVAVPEVTHEWTSHTEFSGEAVCSAEKGHHVSMSVIKTDPVTGQRTFSSATYSSKTTVGEVGQVGQVGPGTAGVTIHAGSSVVGTTTAASAEAHAAGEKGSHVSATVSTSKYPGMGHMSDFPRPSPRAMGPKFVVVT